MSLDSQKFKVLKVSNLAFLQSLKIDQNQHYTILFESVKDSLRPFDLQIDQYSNSTFKLVCIFRHLIEFNLNLNIRGDNTDSQIYNLIDLTTDKKVILDQNITTSFANNQVKHITKCVLDQYSRAYVKHTAKAKNSTKNLKLNQKIQTLILSPNARVKMQPILQIESENVQCKHGSTQGFLDVKAIFYLQSRGLSLQKSTQILVEVFKQEIYSQFVS